MVGTNPRRFPWLRAARQAARISEIVVRILMLRRARRLSGMNTAKPQPHQGRHALGRRSDAERTRKRQPQRTITGTSALSAQTRATTHPIIVHPRKKFRSTIEAVSRLLRAKATMEGQKIHHEAQAN